jgi:hypothetical protein
VALSEADVGVRARAASKLTDPALLARIARRDARPEVRKEAVARLSDPGVLRRILASDEDGAVRAAALAGLPGDPPLFRSLAVEDPSPRVRFQAVARLLDPVLLSRICRNDVSPTVRSTALRRLTDRQALATLARSHPDWRMRKAAVERVDDRAVLTAIAAEDQDADVREAAHLVLDPGWPSAGTPPERIRSLLADPALVALHGPLDLEARVSEDERRYVREDDKGKVLVERVSVLVRSGDGILFEKIYRGKKGRKGESFPDDAPQEDGYRLKVNPAEVDLVEVAEALLRGADADAVEAAARSANKYVRSAAEDVLQGGR